MNMSKTQLAREFCKRLNDYLGAEKMAEIRRRNATADYSHGACATHDFCDANQLMIDAAIAANILPADYESARSDRDVLFTDAENRLFDDAWTLARLAGYVPELILDNDGTRD